MCVLGFLLALSHLSVLAVEKRMWNSHWAPRGIFRLLKLLCALELLGSIRLKLHLKLLIAIQTVPPFSDPHPVCVGFKLGAFL